MQHSPTQIITLSVRCALSVAAAVFFNRMWSRDVISALDRARLKLDAQVRRAAQSLRCSRRKYIKDGE